jgi:hypothetical protein
MVTHASPLTIFVSSPQYTLSGAQAERNIWLDSSFWTILENFENLPATKYASLFTNIGVFNIDPTGQGSAPGNSGTGLNELLILNDSLSPFSGRFNTTQNGSNWLDSNDITKFFLNVGPQTNTLFFFITDAEDVGLANSLFLTVRDSQNNIQNATISNTVLSNGAIHFVGIKSDNPIREVRFENLQRNDGFGLDDFGVIHEAVPEPSSYFLFTSSLIAIGIFKKKTIK